MTCARELRIRCYDRSSDPLGHARELFGRGDKTRGEVAALLGVAPKTLWRALRECERRA